MFNSVVRLMLALIDVEVFNVATAKLAMEDGREKSLNHLNRIKSMKFQWRRSSELLMNQSPIKVSSVYESKTNEEKKTHLNRNRSIFFCWLDSFFSIHFIFDPFFLIVFFHRLMIILDVFIFFYWFVNFVGWCRYYLFTIEYN